MAIDMREFVELAAAEAKKKSGQITVTHAELARAAGVTTGASADFCKVWPVVKAGLDLLKNIVPAWAKWLIDAVVAIGDKICG